MIQSRFSHPIWRLSFVALFFIILASILLWRMVDLTVLHRSFLQSQGNARSLRVIDIPAYRGMILDREGSPLAISTPVESIWINPKTFAPSPKQLKSLSHFLGLSPKQLERTLAQAHSHEFHYLQRQLTPERVSTVKKLAIPGINFQKEFKRYYPEGESTAQLLGFTNIDDNGIEGLELAYQNWLMGVSGKKRVLKDLYGQVIEDLETLKQPRAGSSLQLSIDKRIQFFAYHELQETVAKFDADSGSVVVLDTQTGELLAMVNSPSFNPNARSHYSSNRYRNKALTDIFEPGSVIKSFSIASALESGRFSKDTIVDTRPSRMVVNGHLIRDVHSYGVLDVTGVLRESSNVGMTKMVLQSPPEQLINLLSRCGFAQRTETAYPGESEGSMVKANPFVLATLSFGYGLSVTATQIAKGYSVFANHGELLPIRLIHQDTRPQGEQVMSRKTADTVLEMLEQVVLNGTGKSAKVEGYRVAGKTGTARIAGKHGYAERHYISSFVGIAPVSHPRLVVAVFIHDPKHGGYYGAQVAAPLFAKVMDSALRILDVSPDQSV